METIVPSGTAADALRWNQIYQVQTEQAYWISGGDVTPGTASTQIEVDVASGQANINGTSVSWASNSVALSDANADPRVDVVYVQEDGSLAAVTGTPNAYRPNTDENGNSFTPAPFQHWEPAPNDGSDVLGLPLACVLVKPTTADSTDLASNEIQDRRLSTNTESGYVLGDGTDNGTTTITVDDADFSVQDTTDTVSKYIHRDLSAAKLYLGSPNAAPLFREAVDAGNNNISNIATAEAIEVTRGGDSVVASGDGTSKREIYVQASSPSTSNPYLRFELE